MCFSLFFHYCNHHACVCLLGACHSSWLAWAGSHAARFAGKAGGAQAACVPRLRHTPFRAHFCSLQHGRRVRWACSFIRFLIVWFLQVCNHPYLVKGAQDQICERMTEQAELAEWLIYCSSKFVLLHKLLPKLKTGGHRVLIFSQMVSVLNLLAEYLYSQKYRFERLDGGIRGHDRQVRAYVRCNCQ